jgi:hypothetical protein
MLNNFAAYKCRGAAKAAKQAALRQPQTHFLPSTGDATAHALMLKLSG